MPCDMWQMVQSEHSLKIFASELLPFEIDSVEDYELKEDLINELNNYKGVDQDSYAPHLSYAT